MYLLQIAVAFSRTSLLQIALSLPLIDQILASVSNVHSGIQGHDRDMWNELHCCTGTVCLHRHFLGGEPQIEASNAARNKEYPWHDQLYHHTGRE